MAHQEYKTESSDDESSYEIVEWREFYLSSDSDEGNKCDSEKESDSASENLDVDHEFYDDKTYFDKVRERGVSIRPREAVDIKEMVKEAVLPFLPAKSLTRMKAVSKDWERWIAHPFLAHKQSYCFRGLSGYFCQSGYDAPTFHAVDPKCHGVPRPAIDFLPALVVIKGSCNGLLLCESWDSERWDTDYASYYVCNPANKEWQKIPPSSYFQDSGPAAVLAFEPSELNFAANFSLVRAVSITGSSVISFEVYSSVAGSWSISSAYCFELEEDVVLEDGFYMNGAVYWRASSGQILVYDVKNEIYGILPLAVPQDGLLTWMSGELCYIRAHVNAEMVCRIEIYRGMNMILKRNIELELGREVDGGGRVLACGGGKVVIVRIGHVVYSCDLEKCRADVLSKRVHRDIRYLPYVNSLVSIPMEEQRYENTLVSNPVEQPSYENYGWD